MLAPIGEQVEVNFRLEIVLAILASISSLVYSYAIHLYKIVNTHYFNNNIFVQFKV